MPKTPAHVAVSAVLLLCADSVAVKAQDSGENSSASQNAESTPSDSLSAAELAYENLHVEDAVRLAGQALEEGGRSAREMARIYRLQGVGNAAMGNDRQSREAYLRLLAVDPEASLGQALAPRLREPFASARAFWSSRPVFGINATLGVGGFLLQLEDPIGMIETVRLAHRRDPSQPFARIETSASESVEVQLAGLAPGVGVSYYIQALDAFGNELLRYGSSVAPEYAEIPRRRPSGSGTSDEDDEIWESPWFWVATGTALVAVATVVSIVLLTSGREGNFVIDGG